MSPRAERALKFCPAGPAPLESAGHTDPLGRLPVAYRGAAHGNMRALRGEKPHTLGRGLSKAVNPGHRHAPQERACSHMTHAWSQEPRWHAAQQSTKRPRCRAARHAATTAPCAGVKGPGRNRREDRALLCPHVPRGSFHSQKDQGVGTENSNT